MPRLRGLPLAQQSRVRRPSFGRSKPALGPAPEPSAGLNSFQPRPWAELQGDGPGGRGGWEKKSEDAKTRCSAGDLEDPRGVEETGPFYRGRPRGISPTRPPSCQHYPRPPSLTPPGSPRPVPRCCSVPLARSLTAHVMGSSPMT
jgi:hypothetical protein